MSLFGSLTASVSGLTAQGEAISVISDNLANVNTIGYKANRALFDQLVTTSGISGTLFNAGGVSSNVLRNQNVQGAMVSTQSTTDLGLSGNGFFMVRSSSTVNSLTETFYTRAGAFAEDSEGFLVTPAGFYLNGWRTESDGTIVDVQNPEAIELQSVGASARATTTLELGLNLTSSESLHNYDTSNAFTVEQASIVSDPTTADFVTDARFFDSQGGARDVSIAFVKRAANLWDYQVYTDGSNIDGGTSGTNTQIGSGEMRFNLDGTLRSPTAPESLPKLDKHEHGLKPIELNIWMGFVFLRFLPGDQPKMSELLSRHEKEVAPYGAQDMVPVYGGYWQQEMKVNWKAVRDVDNEGYHVPMAHPGLHDLYGKNYYDEPIVNGTNRSFGELTDSPGHLWSVRHYKKILPDFPNLSGPNKRAWLYIGIFPNTVISFYPESAAFYQEYPLASGRTLQRGATYRYAEESREMRLSRYLAERIDKLTTEEDTQLIYWTCEAMESSAFDGIILSDREYGVRAYHDKLRDLLPVMSLPQAPAAGTIAETNAKLAEERSVAAE